MFLFALCDEKLIFGLTMGSAGINDLTGMRNGTIII
jgi:hypothetical protein